MAELKTKQNEISVEQFLDSIEGEDKRRDCREIVKIMEEVAGYPPKMWGASIIGFGKYHYIYDSGHEGDAALVSFSPRKQNISIYLMGGLDNQEDLLKVLGKHKVGKGCLYINKLSDINIDTLKKLIRNTVETLQIKYS